MPTINKSLAILALLAFFLPFITISCNGTAMVQMSGAKLAQCSVSTCSPDDFLGPQLKAMAGRNISKMDIPATNWGGKDNPFNNANYVLFAAIAGLIAAITLFLGRPGEILSGVASVGALALLFVFKSKFGDAVTPHLTSPDIAAASALIKIELQFSIGFWASALLSAASAILAFKGTNPRGIVLSGAGGTTGSVGSLPQQPPGHSSTSRQSLSACPSCGAAAAPGNKFCLSCGGSLAAPEAPSAQAPAAPEQQDNSCPACGVATAPDNKFCLSCGTPLAAAGAPVQPSEAVSPAMPTATRAAAAAAAPVAQMLPFTAPSVPEPASEAPVETAAAAAAERAAAPPVPEQPAPAPATFEEPVARPEASVEEAPTPAAQPQAQQACAACGAALAPEQRFCLACGTAAGQSVGVVETPAPPSSNTVPVTPPASAVPFQEGPFQAPPRSGAKALIIAVVLIAIFGAAGWYAWQYFARPDVSVTAIPQKIHVAAGGRTLLQANVSGSKDTDVKWSIQEGDKGGQITPQGDMVEGNQSRATATYTAPQTPGTFHVIAASHANPGRTAKVEIVVGGGIQGETAQTPEKPAATPPPATSSAPASPMAAQIIGTWRGPTADMNTTIGVDSTIAMTSDANPQKNLRGTYHFTDSSHIQIDFGGGDVRTWEIVGVDDKYLRVTAQTSNGASAMIFSKLI